MDPLLKFTQKEHTLGYPKVQDSETGLHNSISSVMLNLSWDASHYVEKVYTRLHIVVTAELKISDTEA